MSSKFGGVIPESGEAPGAFVDSEVDALDPTFLSDINALLQEYIDSMEAIKIRHSLSVVMAISSRGNEYLQHTKFFDLFKTDPVLCAKVTSRAINLIYALSALIHPFMPSTSTEMLVQLNAPARTVPTVLSNDILAGHQLGKPDYLFTKIDEKSADIWRPKFGGVQANAAAVEVVVPKPLSKKAAAAAKKQNKVTEARVVSPSVPRTNEIIAAEEQVKAQGDKVRRIKAGEAQEGDESLEDAIKELQKLKVTLQKISTQ